jgi:hypothetical protein
MMNVLKSQLAIKEKSTCIKVRTTWLESSQRFSKNETLHDNSCLLFYATTKVLIAIVTLR